MKLSTTREDIEEIEYAMESHNSQSVGMENGLEIQVYWATRALWHIALQLAKIRKLQHER